MLAVQTASATCLKTRQEPDLHQEIAGVIHTLEHLAVRATYAQEPCAQILLRTAELLRIAVLQR
jgi:hypothetical protein